MSKNNEGSIKSRMGTAEEFEAMLAWKEALLEKASSDLEMTRSCMACHNDLEKLLNIYCQNSPHEYTEVDVAALWNTMQMTFALGHLAKKDSK